MARRRTSHRRRSSSGGFGIVKTAAIGAVGLLLINKYVAPQLNLSPQTLGIVELAAGVFLASKSGIVGNVGKAAVFVGLYALAGSFLGGMAGGQGISVSSFNY